MAGLEFRKRTQERLKVKLQPRCCKRVQRFGDASTRRQPPRTAAGVAWSQSGIQAVCVTEDRAREVTQTLWRSSEDHERLQTLAAELFTLLELGFI